MSCPFFNDRPDRDLPLRIAAQTAYHPAARIARSSVGGHNMTHRTVEAGRGIEWLKQIIEIIKGNPVAFLVMGLILGVIAIIPLLGSLAILVLLPTFYAGFCYAAREQTHGRQADIKHLFQGFNEPGRIGPLVTLCLPQVAAGVVAVILVVMLVGGAMLSGGLAAGGDADPTAMFAALGGTGFVLFLLLFALFVAVWLMLIFAIPRVMFEGEAPFAAMKDSFTVALANLVPIIVFALIVGICFMIIGAILAFIPLPGMIAAVAIFYAVIGVAHYVIWRDICGDQVESASLPPAPPA